MQPTTGLLGAAMTTRDGSIRAQVAAGPADIEAGTECTPQTRFQLCSVSKQFAAVAALLLVESGQLDLGEPVTRWLPAFPPPWPRVTLHHLLSHTAGIGHWHEVPGLDPAPPMTPDERLALIQAAGASCSTPVRWPRCAPRTRRLTMTTPGRR